MRAYPNRFTFAHDTVVGEYVSFLAVRRVDDPLTSVVNGTVGNDTLVGSVGDDILNGFDGDDILEGRAGADVLNGGNGIDTVTYANAESFVRVFISGGGNPFGESVGDTYTSIENIIGSNFSDYLSGNGQNNRIYGGNGDDALYGFGGLGSTSYLYGGNGIDTLLGSLGADVMDGGEGENTVSYYLSAEGVTISLIDPSANTGWAAGDTYVNIQDVIGTNANDLIYGNNDFINQLQGQDGDDILYGVGSAYTVLIGGAGADQLHAGTGGNLIDYETATAGVTASMANPEINTGDAAGDTYFGLYGHDLAGSPYDDVLYGDDGNNNIIGDPELVVYIRSGVDRLYGNGGDDTLDGGPNGDVLDGGTGFDAAAYQISLSGVHAYLGSPGSNMGDAAGDTYVSIEALIGSNFNDVLGGDASNNSLFSYAGNDELRGEDGDDLLVGGEGADRLVGGAGTDLAVYSESTIGLNINMSSPQFSTGVALGDTYVEVEGIFGTNFADQISGNDFANILRGESGNDILGGAGGNDTLIGGAGADQMDGGAGYNIASYATADAGVRASLSNPDVNAGEAVGDTYSNIQQINGSGFADVLTGLNANGSTLRGLGGNDILYATAFGTQLNGDDGDDMLNGGFGDDVLLGGAGGDQIHGGGGTDLVSYVTSTSGVALALISGGFGGDAAGDTFSNVENVAGTHFNDTITGNGMANRLLGLSGADTLNGGDGDDLLEGGAAADILNGGAGYDYATYLEAPSGVNVSLVGGPEAGDASGDQFVSIEGVLGSAFDDRITGDSTSNTIQGFSGNDVLDGGAATDLLVGGDGDDTIIGGLGNDSLFGGSGADTFLFRSVSESFESATVASDMIEDFQTGADKIDISGFQPSSVAITQQNGLTYVVAQSASGPFTVRVNGVVAASDIVLTATGQQINGTLGSDTLIGTEGADVIVGGLGADSLTGLGGADTFRYLTIDDSTSQTLDIIQDFQTGVDRIDITALNSLSYSLIRYNGDSYMFAVTPNGFQFYTAAFGVVNGSDILFTNNHGVYMIGSEQGETLIGSANNDPIQGDGGDDILIGGVGGDAISGGAGADRFVYRSSAESVADGGRYDNLYDFETGVDAIDMTALDTSSISVIRSGGSSFVFANTPGGAFQIIAAGRDINGGDFTYGSSHGIYLVGSSGADLLRGSVKGDSFQAGDGNDLLIGGLGGDYMAGEGGADIYQYLSAAESGIGDSDRIGTFQTGVDRIDLSAVRTGGSDFFNIIYSDGGSFIFVDLGGNGANDMLIQATSIINASDVIWNSPGSALVAAARDDSAEFIAFDENVIGLPGQARAFESGSPITSIRWDEVLAPMHHNPIVSTGDIHHQDWFV